MELNKYFNLQFERADDATISKRLIGGAKIKGPALLILIFSIFIASIGLNMNSTAVVIGAMLISPLMGPILAIGFGFATLNFTVAKSGIFKIVRTDYDCCFGICFIFFIFLPFRRLHLNY